MTSIWDFDTSPCNDAIAVCALPAPFFHMISGAMKSIILVAVLLVTLPAVPSALAQCVQRGSQGVTCNTIRPIAPDPDSMLKTRVPRLEVRKPVAVERTLSEQVDDTAREIRAIRPKPQAAFPDLPKEP